MSFCEFLIKILIKHPSKYKILRSKTVEEVSRTDERADMGKLICRSTSIAKSSRKCERFFNPPLAFCGLLSHVKKNSFVSVVSRFVSFRFVSALSCFVSVVSRFVSFLLVLFSFVSFLVLQSPVLNMLLLTNIQRLQNKMK